LAAAIAKAISEKLSTSAMTVTTELREQVLGGVKHTERGVAAQPAALTGGESDTYLANILGRDARQFLFSSRRRPSGSIDTKIVNE
jgi:hypothetical protein